MEEFECHQCNYTILNKNDLIEHVQRVHEKIKKYKCEICEKSFSQSQTLKNHNKSKHPSQFSKIYKEDITYFECDSIHTIDIIYQLNLLKVVGK